MARFSRPVFGFQFKILFSYLLIAFLFMAFALTFWSVRMAEEQKKEQLKQLSELTEQASRLVDALMLDANSALYLHRSSDTLRDILGKRERNPSEYDEDRRTIRLLLQGVIRQSDYISAVSYLGLNSVFYSSYDSGIDDAGYFLLHLHRIRLKNGTPYIGEVYDGVINGNRRNLLPIAKELIDTGSGRRIGWIIVYMDFTRFCRTLEDETGISGENLTLLSRNGDELYRSQSALHKTFTHAAQELADTLSASSDAPRSVSGDRYIASAALNSQTGWTIVKYRPLEDAHSASESVSAFLLACFFFLLVMIAAGYFFSKRFSHGIRRLHDAFGEARGGLLRPVSEAGLANDEIGDLTHGYNRMAARLNESIRREYIAKINEKEMQLRMLRFQINPHFLYNSLNLISSIAELEDVPEISRISRMLGEMFRYSIKGAEFVLVEEEMCHVRNYLAIQAFRFPEDFTYSCTASPDAARCLCPKFILQPLAENVFAHAFRSSRSRRRIEISAVSSETDLVFKVCDNGCGIPPERLVQINASLKSGYSLELYPEVESIGILNVNDRIRSYFGDPYGLSVQSCEGAYTCVRIRMPRKENEAHEDSGG